MMKLKHIPLIALVLLAAVGAKGQPVLNGLQAHYLFDGNLLDASPNGHDLGLISGNVSYTLEGSGDHSIYFDGTSSVSTISPFDNSSATEMAVSLWVRTTNITSGLQICLQGAYMGFGAYIQPNTGHFMGFFDSSSSGAAVSSAPVTDNHWHHIVIQNDGSTTYMYVDGVLDTSIPDALQVGNGDSYNKLYLGKSNLDAQPFTGYLNDARIYDRMLSASEISSLYQGAGSTTTPEPEIPEIPEISIYPNPTHQDLTIDFKGDWKRVAAVEVIDMLGKTVYQQFSINSQNLTIQLSGRAGMYFVRVTTESGSSILRQVVKE